MALLLAGLVSASGGLPSVAAAGGVQLQPKQTDPPKPKDDKPKDDKPKDDKPKDDGDKEKAADPKATEEDKDIAALEALLKDTVPPERMADVAQRIDDLIVDTTFGGGLDKIKALLAKVTTLKPTTSFEKRSPRLAKILAIRQLVADIKKAKEGDLAGLERQLYKTTNELLVNTSEASANETAFIGDIAPDYLKLKIFLHDSVLPSFKKKTDFGNSLSVGFDVLDEKIKGLERRYDVRELGLPRETPRRLTVTNGSPTSYFFMASGIAKRPADLTYGGRNITRINPVADKKPPDSRTFRFVDKFYYYEPSKSGTQASSKDAWKFVAIPESEGGTPKDKEVTLVFTARDINGRTLWTKTEKVEPKAGDAKDPNAKDPNAGDAKDPNAKDPNAKDPNAKDPNAGDAKDPKTGERGRSNGRSLARGAWTLLAHLALPAMNVALLPADLPTVEAVKEGLLLDPEKPPESLLGDKREDWKPTVDNLLKNKAFVPLYDYSLKSGSYGPTPTKVDYDILDYNKMLSAMKDLFPLFKSAVDSLKKDHNDKKDVSAEAGRMEERLDKIIKFTNKIKPRADDLLRDSKASAEDLAKYREFVDDFFTGDMDGPKNSLELVGNYKEPIKKEEPPTGSTADLRELREDFNLARAILVRNVDELQRARAQSYTAWRKDPSSGIYSCSFRYQPAGGDDEVHNTCVYYSDDPGYVYYFADMRTYSYRIPDLRATRVCVNGCWQDYVYDYGKLQNYNAGVCWGRFRIAALDNIYSSSAWEEIPRDRRQPIPFGYRPAPENFASAAALPRLPESLDPNQLLLWPSTIGLPGNLAVVVAPAAPAPSGALETALPVPPAPAAPPSVE